MTTLHESKNCTHGYNGARYRYGNVEYTSCPLCNSGLDEKALKALNLLKDKGYKSEQIIEAMRQA